jgi:hypothetical protein
MNREELRKKLQNKLKGMKNNRTSKVTDKEQVIDNTNMLKNMPKSKKDLDNLKKEMNKMLNNTNTVKVTALMESYYDLTVKKYDKIMIPTPQELLMNVEVAKNNFKDYLNALIDNCKEKNISKEVFIKDYLNSLYTEYHVVVLTIDVVPEKLRSQLSLSFLDELNKKN